MKLVKTLDQHKLTIAIEGRLDTSTAPELDACLQESLADATELVLDFAALDYISSAGLRILLKTQKQMSAKGTMKLIHVNDDIRDVFDITGFLDILTIE